MQDRIAVQCLRVFLSLIAEYVVLFVNRTGTPPVIPVIPFSAELQRIGETIETVAEVQNALEMPVNSGYYR